MVRGVAEPGKDEQDGPWRMTSDTLDRKATEMAIAETALDVVDNMRTAFAARLNPKRFARNSPLRTHRASKGPATRRQS